MRRASDKPTIVIAYDVADDRIRNRMAKILQSMGARRIQKSVFELEADSKSLARLKRRLSRLRQRDDRIVYYKLCRVCRRQAVYAGPVPKSGAGVRG